jgi:hypothetical protein
VTLPPKVAEVVAIDEAAVVVIVGKLIIVIAPLVRAAFEKLLAIAPPLIVRLACEPIVNVNDPLAVAAKSVVIK